MLFLTAFHQTNSWQHQKNPSQQPIEKVKRGTIMKKEDSQPHTSPGARAALSTETRIATSPTDAPSDVNSSSEERVSLWHFPMMNDEVRNGSYDQALGSALKKKKGSVLDIGTGSGLLALMAARHGATQVVTCEAVPKIARKARQIIQQNGYSDRIRVVEGFSTGLKVGQDVPERFDILVTEIFDDGLLGEEAFKSIKHAKDHLLKEGAQIIPARARTLVMGIESHEIFKNYRVGKTAGFDLQAFNEFSITDYVGIHLDKMSYRPLTLPVEVFNLDFNNPTFKESRPLDLIITEPGVLHAIAYWFELDLDDNTTLSSAPGLAQLSSWKQAIQLIESPDSFQKGDHVSFTANHDESSIWFNRC
jgi:protein arginine N-methyltransferase 7